MTVCTNSRDKMRGTGRKRKGEVRSEGERWLKRDTDKRKQKKIISTDSRSYLLKLRKFLNLKLQRDAMHLLGLQHCCYGNPSRA